MSSSLFIEFYIAGLIVGSVIRARYTRKYRRNTMQDTRPSMLDRLLLLLVSLGMFFIPFIYITTSWLDFADYALPALPTAVLGCTGAVVFVVALWLLWRSHADLAQNWSPVLGIHNEHTLVTSGVYTTIRHPMYAAHWLWAIAQLLLLQNWIAGWAMLFCLIPLYLVRVQREEQMMLEHFGDEYQAYVERTGRIIPRWRKS